MDEYLEIKIKYIKSASRPLNSCAGMCISRPKNNRLYESDVLPSQYISTYFIRRCRCFVTFSTQYRLTSKKKFWFLFQSASNFLAHGKRLLLGSIYFIDCLNQIPACMVWIIWFKNAGPFTMVIRGPIENIYQFCHSHESGGLSCKISTTTSFSANVLCVAMTPSMLFELQLRLDLPKIYTDPS